MTLASGMTWAAGKTDTPQGLTWTSLNLFPAAKSLNCSFMSPIGQEIGGARHRDDCRKRVPIRYRVV